MKTGSDEKSKRPSFLFFDYSSLASILFNTFYLVPLIFLIYYIKAKIFVLFFVVINKWLF